MARNGFPRGHKALVNEGFVCIGAGKCPDCSASVPSYRTPACGRRTPIDAAKKIPHWWICRQEQPEAGRDTASAACSSSSPRG
jgi:hypothetical protein